MTDLQPPASHFIDGAFTEDAAGDPIDSMFPATGETVARLHAATPAIVEAALASATAGQAAWAAMDGAARGRVLCRAAGLMRDRNRALSLLETYDTGKPLQETLVADAASGADTLDYFGGLAADLTGTTLPLGRDWAYTLREPLGVCVGIGAWNYPTQIACWKAAPALAAGNAMVFKPSEITPLGALQVAAILHEAGLPPGVFNVLQGGGDVGAALVDDPRVAKVSLTGSAETGRRVYSLAAQGMKQATMELGGKSPLIVFDDAGLDDAVAGALLGNMYSAGQICSNGTRVFVQRSVLAPFLDRLKARVEAMIVGDPRDEATQLGPLVSETQMHRVLGFVDRGRTAARLVTGGHRLDRPGFYVAPTVFADVTDDMEIAREEIFGPVMSVLSFETEAEVTARANATPYGLSAGIFTADLTRAHRMAQRLQAGTVWINAYNLTPAGMPFGGVKASGFGRENARAAMESYTRTKSVYVGMGPVDAPY
ncbi:betaine aldehyde dehydrogenase [Oceaniovalibus guishaninsula JLT2003]|uniref:Betaine aldehyde dehydrogenase n=1 Tax=Oceaniovalibus guishaninsula JLT2003 TaxID=1231392 RepID=K2I6U8_9RHOB|nr:betaine-aldehyde dehydrogenase [Oceaniovalibus guishaninsula]EKE44710.1 betaine aldehyde dehydrogenase [Oceaniovalibus guishaninsula JLT2003]